MYLFKFSWSFDTCLVFKYYWNEFSLTEHFRFLFCPFFKVTIFLLFYMSHGLVMTCFFVLLFDNSTENITIMPFQGFNNLIWGLSDYFCCRKFWSGTVNRVTANILMHGGEFSRDPQLMLQERTEKETSLTMSKRNLPSPPQL